MYNIIKYISCILYDIRYICEMFVDICFGGVHHPRITASNQLTQDMEKEGIPFDSKFLQISFFSLEISLGDKK